MQELNIGIVANSFLINISLKVVVTVVTDNNSLFEYFSIYLFLYLSYFQNKSLLKTNKHNYSFDHFILLQIQKPGLVFNVFNAYPPCLEMYS